MLSWQKRLLAERDALREKLHALDAFQTTDEFKALPEVDKVLMKNQSYHMFGYLQALVERCKRF